MTFLNIILGIFFLAIFISVLWHLYSRYYSLPCPAWLAWMVEQDNPFLKINRATTIIQTLDLTPGMVALDAGCGPGRLTIPLAQKVGPHGMVTAMDIQAGMLGRTRERARAADLTNITFLQAGLGERKLPHNTFDRAVLVTVLGEIPNREAALKEIFDALKPGGILSVTEIILDPHFHRRSTVLRLASAAGFRERKTFGNWYAYTLNLERPA